MYYYIVRKSSNSVFVDKVSLIKLKNYILSCYGGMNKLITIKPTLL